MAPTTSSAGTRSAPAMRRYALRLGWDADRVGSRLPLDPGVAGPHPDRLGERLGAEEHIAHLGVGRADPPLDPVDGGGDLGYRLIWAKEQLQVENHLLRTVMNRHRLPHARDRGLGQGDAS